MEKKMHLEEDKKVLQRLGVGLEECVRELVGLHYLR